MKNRSSFFVGSSTVFIYIIVSLCGRWIHIVSLKVNFSEMMLRKELDFPDTVFSIYLILVPVINYDKLDFISPKADIL